MGADTRTHTGARSESADVLISQLEELVENGRGSTSSIRSPLPSTRQMFGIGKLMFQFDARNSSDLPMAYQHFIESLPETYLKKLFAAYQTALTTLLKDSKSRDDNNKDSDLVEASQALCGFFANSPLLCKTVYSKDWVSSLAAVYDRLLLSKNACTSTEVSKDVVLSSISFLLLDGMFFSPNLKGSSSIEDLLLQAIRSMEDESTDCLNHLQQWQATHEPFRRTLQSALLKSSPNTKTKDQDDETNMQQLREYILNMLESARHHQQQHTSVAAVATPENRKSTGTAQKIQKNKPKPVSAADELERRIHQVKQILPEFGEGFLESALSLYQGDVETTVSMLLQDQSDYPTSLRMLDKTLPRRRKERSKEEAKESAQARQLVKERVAVEEQREQERYKALLYMAEREREEQQEQNEHEESQDENQQLTPDHNEYDDDYDDQYDDIDVKLGGADDGMYDFEQVKLYNQTAKQEEAESSFWEENRNTNRQANAKTPNKPTATNDGGQGKQYRGPDKIKGGRIIGPDGKIVKNNRGRGKKKPSAASSSGQKQNQNQETKQQQNNASAASTQVQKGKPKTSKPKSNNRINRQRDKKQKAQGTFGAQG